jgi:signal transduction histidine kinase
MVAMGEMLGNIAHQWRQPLSVISTSATAMMVKKEMNISDYDMEMQAYETINNTAQHLSNTIDDFRNFFNSSKEIALYDLKEIYTSTLNLIHSALKADKINVIEIDIKSVEVLCLDSEFTQVLMNIFNNAKDVLVENKIEDKYIFISIEKNDVEGIITIKDNGGGIPEDFIDKIFEPYFTTKHQSQGTGIGLYMSQEIIVRHLCGSLIVQNKEYEYKGKQYKGAEFIIKLPLESK